MQIAEIGVVTPGMRGHAEQSMPARPRSARTRSPFASSPAGPPSGPAKRVGAPRRAVANAALAALPPLTDRNSLAGVFTSPRAKASTRKTSSSTAMPVHRIRRGRDASVEDTVALLHPDADDMVGDSDRHRSGEALGMRPREHQRG